MCKLHIQTAGKKDIAGLERPRRAGGSCRDRDSVHVQHEQDGLTLDILERDIERSRKTELMVLTSVDHNMRNLGENAFPEGFAHLPKAPVLLLHVLHGELCGDSGSVDADGVVGSGSSSVLLFTAVYKRHERCALSCEQNSHTLGAVELVSAAGQVVELPFLA